jgi:enterochelin esterase-like enzyme
MAVLFCVLIVLAGCQTVSVQPLPVETAIPVPSAAPTVIATLPLQPSATPAGCQETTGRLEWHELPAGTAPYSIPFQVYLPPCYDPQGGPYPLLVLLHGQSDTGELWMRMGVQPLADDLVNNGEAPPFVILMPTEAYYLQDFLESVFDQALFADLLPWVEANYAVSTDRNCRALGGISRGAAWSALLGIENWEQFAAIGTHSVPNAPYSEVRLKSLLDEIPAGSVPRIWMDTGDMDRYRKSAKEFEELLTRRGVPHEWHLNEGAHEEAYWQAYLEDYLRWYASPWWECVE